MTTVTLTSVKENPTQTNSLAMSLQSYSELTGLALVSLDVAGAFLENKYLRVSITNTEVVNWIPILLFAFDCHDLAY